MMSKLFSANLSLFGININFIKILLSINFVGLQQKKKGTHRRKKQLARVYGTEFSAKHIKY